MIISIPLLLSAKQGSIDDVLLTNKAFISEIREQYPESDIEIISTKLGRFASVYQDSIRHFAVSTADFSSVMGYKGYSNLIVYIDQTGNVEDVTFVESQDTKPYVKKVLRTKILSELSDQNITSPGRPSYLVTGATITSNVFNKSIAQTLDAFGAIFDQLVFENSTLVIPDSLMIQNKQKTNFQHE
jgi:Na+-translocating ferredoxin:NAD+ oxidoreductase RnfG subunit